MKLLSYIFILVFLAFPAYAKDTQSFFNPFKLQRVIDGDTIVASGKTIRLWGIDAPEKGHPLYNVATMYLKSILAEGGLACKLIDIDRYGRSVMHCTVQGDDIGAMLVQMGMAKDFTKYSGGFYQAEQQEAKAKARGLWAKTAPPKK